MDNGYVNRTVIDCLQHQISQMADVPPLLTSLAFGLLFKLINEQGGIFRLLHKKLRTGWKENLKNLSEHALLLGTSE